MQAQMDRFNRQLEKEAEERNRAWERELDQAAAQRRHEELKDLERQRLDELERIRRKLES